MVLASGSKTKVSCTVRQFPHVVLMSSHVALVLIQTTILTSQVALIERMVILHLYGDKCLLHEARTVTVNNHVKIYVLVRCCICLKNVHVLYQIIWHIFLVKAFSL